MASQRVFLFDRSPGDRSEIGGGWSDLPPLSGFKLVVQ